MAEVVGLVASVVQLAGAGLKLSQALYQYADGVATADRRIKNIANEVKLTSLVIQELGSIFKRDETANLISENAVKTANEIIKECSAVFTEIEVIVNKSKPGKMGRLMLPFRDNKIELLPSQIDKLKSTLELLMQVLIHAHQVSSNRLNREAEAKQREEIKQLLENKKQSTKKYEESLKNFSISDGSTAVDDEERSLPEDDETAPSSHLFKAASAIGSTINSETLAKCVDHVRSLLADIETLQFALAEKVDGDDHSNHHQKAIGTYFVARSHLDSVLLGNSKANISQIQSRQNTIIHNTKKSACKNSSSASSTVYENPDGGNINANTDIFDIGLNFGDDASAIEDFDFDSFQHVGAGKDKFTFGLNERERQSRDGQRIERVKMSMVSPRPRRREIDGEPIPLPTARSVDTKTMGSSYKGAAREETPLDRTLAEKDAYRTKQREGHSRIKRRDMREEKKGEEGEKGLKLEEAKRGQFTTPWQEGFPQEEFRRREGASCATRVDRFSRQRLPPPTQSSHSVRRVPRALIEERRPSVSRTVSDQITPSPEKDRLKTIPTRPLEISYYNAGKNSFASRMCVSRERPLPGTNQCHKEYEHLRSERGNERGETRANGMEKARAEERQRLRTEKEQQRRHQQDQERGKMPNERLPSRLAEKQSQAQEELLRVEKEAMVREKEVSPRGQKPQPKISLGDFLGDQTPGPWADEMEDAPIAAKTEAGGRFRSDTGSSKPSNVDEVDELLREWTTVLG